MTTTIHQTLIQARALIADPAGWTQECFARNAQGTDVDPRGPHACRFCTIGALRHVTPANDPIYSDAINVLYEVADVVGCDGSLVSINDTLGHEAALRVYDLAIERTRP